jgi:hypothetical protein
MINKITIFIFILPAICTSQSLTGRVVDKLTQQPIETTAVYFDNTTIGTTTNSKGEFTINYTDAVQSALVISYLGYEKVLISNFRNQNNILVVLIEADNTLDEVYIEYDDGLTRRQKLKLFRREFLGTSKYAKSCKVLNEDDIFLKYDKQNKTLYASSGMPVLVENERLQYKIAFDIVNFEINFRYVAFETSTFRVNSVTYFGTSFYKELEDSKKRKTITNREVAYKGSVQHFIRALYNKLLEEEGYVFGNEGFKVNPYDFFSIYDADRYGYKTVILKEKLGVFYAGDKDSVIQTTVSQFYVDEYGNYTPIGGVLFGGDMGGQRVGDMLPSDYGLTMNK